MTLKEFSKNILSNDTEDGQKPQWKKAFPTELRQHNVLRKKGGLFLSDKYHEVLEEKWVRYHKGDVIDIEWRLLPYETDEPWEY